MQPFCQPITDSNWIDEQLIATHEPYLQSALSAAVATYNFPPVITSSLLSPKNKTRVLWELARTGFLPRIITLDTPYHNTALTPEQRKQIHPDIAESLAGTLRPPIARHCITRNEDWWTGPSHFTVESEFTYLLSEQYSRACGKPELQVWRPKTRRAAGESSGPNVLYQEWLALCADRKKVLESLQDDLDAALATVAACRTAIRKHEREGVTWQEYRAANTM